MVAESLEDLEVSAVVTAEYLKVVPQQRSGQRVRENAWLPQRGVSKAGSGGEHAPLDTNALPVAMVEVQEVNSC